MGENERYNRQTILPGFGPAAQQKLAKANVLVIGAGGLGVPVLQYLTGMGVGTIGIIDGDMVSLSNLHRQVLYTESDIGHNKAMAAAGRLMLLNSDIKFYVFTRHISVSDALTVIEPYDIVVDATDNFTARYLINDACVILKKPFVYGAVHQYEGQVSIFNVDGGATYRCLYPTMPAISEIPDCNTSGVLGIAPGIIGCNMALEAVKLLTSIGKSSAGQLHIFDFLHGSQFTIQLKANPENQHITALQKSYELPACAAIADLQVGELLQWYETGKKFILVDLRDEEDFEAAHLAHAQFFTTNLLQHATELNNGQPVAVICYRGHRSLQAAVYLQQKYPQLPIYHVTAGMDGWQKEIGNKYLLHD